MISFDKVDVNTTLVLLSIAFVVYVGVMLTASYVGRQKSGYLKLPVNGLITAFWARVDGREYQLGDNDPKVEKIWKLAEHYTDLVRPAFWITVKNDDDPKLIHTIILSYQEIKALHDAGSWYYTVPSTTHERRGPA